MNGEVMCQWIELRNSSKKTRYGGWGVGGEITSRDKKMENERVRHMED